MSRTLAIAGRDFRAFFLTPGGYIILALFVIITGLVFVLQAYQQGAAASMRPVFDIGTWVLLFIGPAVTMRCISEELRLGTFETLMTCPVTEPQVIAGKFIAAAAMLAVLLAPTTVYVLVLELHGRPDYGELACGYLGMLLAGSAYLASGLLASTLTSSQVVAFLLTLFFWLTLGVSAKVAPRYLDDRSAAIAFAIDPDLRLKDFAIGLLDTSNLVYFVSISAVSLMAATTMLRLRRLR